MPIDTVFVINNNNFSSMIFLLVIAVIGAFAGAYFTSKLAINTIKKQESIKAAAKFRSAFVDFLYELKAKIVIKEADIQISKIIIVIVYISMTISLTISLTIILLLAAIGRELDAVRAEYFETIMHGDENLHAEYDSEKRDTKYKTDVDDYYKARRPLEYTICIILIFNLLLLFINII